MGMFDFLKRERNTADSAKGRLQFLIAQQRGSNSSEPDYLPLMRSELLAVIKKYVTGLDDDAVHVNVEKSGDYDVLDIRVDLPDSKSNAVA